MLKKTAIFKMMPAKIRGAGDVVHAVAHPIAIAIDFVAGTDLQNCKGCAKRRENLNQKIPL